MSLKTILEIVGLMCVGETIDMSVSSKTSRNRRSGVFKNDLEMPFHKILFESLSI